MSVTRREGSAGELHARPLELDGGQTRLVEELVVTRPALVLGSTQPDLDRDRIGRESSPVDVVRRRSGGGAVWLDDDALWFDVTLSDADPRWDDDVGRSFEWLGDAVNEMCRSVGLDTDVHRGRLVDHGAARLVCFDGVGPGEVVVDGRKLMGWSQRRTRGVARFQGVVYRRWNPEPMLSLLDLDAATRARVRTSGVGLAELGVDVGAWRRKFLELFCDT